MQDGFEFWLPFRRIHTLVSRKLGVISSFR
jgi:hypothetical protein